jgi:inner membrane protein
MAVSLLYWHWIVLGMVLIVLEIFIPTFTILWFGVGAIAVGVVLLIAPGLSLALQLVLWALLSGVCTWAWFKYLKPLSVDKTKAGLSRESVIGEVGQVLRLPVGDERGKVRFPAPVLGDDEWMFITTEELQLGDRVRVVDVSGNALMVVKV